MTGKLILAAEAEGADKERRTVRAGLGVGERELRHCVTGESIEAEEADGDVATVLNSSVMIKYGKALGRLKCIAAGSALDLPTMLDLDLPSMLEENTSITRALYAQLGSLSLSTNSAVRDCCRHLQLESVTDCCPHLNPYCYCSDRLWPASLVSVADCISY